MILSKRPCPDCKGTGIAPERGGLCPKCNGEGKRRPTREEEERGIDLAMKCQCQGGTGKCNGNC